MEGQKPAVHLLLVEDEVVYSKMILYQLSRLDLTEYNLSVNHVSSMNELEEIKDFLIPDLILLDLGLPEISGKETFHATKKLFPESAIIILTGNDDDELANFMVKSGAQDYLVKSDADSKVLRKTIEYSLDRFKFQNEISDSVFKYRDLFQNSPTPLFLIKSSNKKIRVVNSALSKLMDCRDEDVTIESLEKQLEHCITTEMTSNYNFCLNLILRTCKNDDLKVQLVGSKLKYQEGYFVCQLIPQLSGEQHDAKPSNNFLEKLMEKMGLIKVLLKSSSKDSNMHIDSVLELVNEIEEMVNKELPGNNEI